MCWESTESPKPVDSPEKGPVMRNPKSMNYNVASIPRILKLFDEPNSQGYLTSLGKRKGIS